MFSVSSKPRHEDWKPFTKVSITLQELELGGVKLGFMNFKRVQRQFQNIVPSAIYCLLWECEGRLALHNIRVMKSEKAWALLE